MSGILLYANLGKNVGLGHWTRIKTYAEAFTRLNVPIHLSTSEEVETPISTHPCSNSGEFYDLAEKIQSESGLRAVILDSYQDDLEEWISGFDIPVFAIDDFKEKIDLPLKGLIHLGPYSREDFPREIQGYSFIGLQYYPLRQDWLNIVHKPRASATPLLGVVMGGADPQKQALRLTDLILKSTPYDLRIFLGPLNEDKDQIPQSNRIEIFHASPQFIDKISECDFVITAGGVTSLELAHMGMPIVILPLSEDQLALAKRFTRSEAAVCLQHYEKTKDEEILSALESLQKSSVLKKKLSTHAKKLIDGKGAKRFAEEFLRRIPNS